VTSRVITGTLASARVHARMDYRIIVPATAVQSPLPLLLHLHGAMSSAASLHEARSSYEAAWRRGELPPCVVACVSTPTRGGFYMDHADGPNWEAFVAEDFAAHVSRCVPVSAQRALLGISMGGYGALKMAFRHPERYVAVAALCPAIFPGETPVAVPQRNLNSILGELHRAMGTCPAQYARQCVPALARTNADRIRASRPSVFFECGRADEFLLHDGALYLQHLLIDLRLEHAFQSLPDMGHAGPAMTGRLDRALRFVGRALSHRLTAETLAC